PEVCHEGRGAEVAEDGGSHADNSVLLPLRAAGVLPGGRSVVEVLSLPELGGDGSEASPVVALGVPGRVTGGNEKGPADRKVRGSSAGPTTYAADSVDAVPVNSVDASRPSRCSIVVHNRHG